MTNLGEAQSQYNFSLVLIWLLKIEMARCKPNNFRGFRQVMTQCKGTENVSNAILNVYHLAVGQACAVSSFTR